MIDTRTHPRHAGASGDAAAAWRLLFFVMAGAFVGMGIAVFLAGLLPGDLSVRYGLVLEDGSPYHALARVVNVAGTWRVLLPASLILFACFAAARRRWWLWSGVFLGAGAIEHIVKFLVARPRPSGFASGFPSGHTTAAAVFAVFVLYDVGRSRLSPAVRHAVCALAVTTMVLVGWARIVLRAHWPTDVLGGFLLGIACAAAAAWWDARHGQATAIPLPRPAAEPVGAYSSGSSELS
jgi:membrane-associated phospholipid phosphatase